MGLDLTISEQTDFRKDELGRPCHTVTELLTIHGKIGHLFLDHVGGLSELSNCSTMTIDAMDIFEGLNTLRETYSEFDTENIKKEYEEKLNAWQELRTNLCEKHSIENRDVLSKWDGLCTEKELEQKNRLTREEKDNLNQSEKELLSVKSTYADMNEYEDIIAEIETFIKGSNLKKSALTWGDRTFEVHIWY